MLYLIGLGLADETDITVKGLELVKRAERVYLEAYTSILLVETSRLVQNSRLLSTKFYKADIWTLCSRKLIMGDPSLLPIAKWLSLPVTRY